MHACSGRPCGQRHQNAAWNFSRILFYWIKWRCRQHFFVFRRPGGRRNDIQYGHNGSRCMGRGADNSINIGDSFYAGAAYETGCKITCCLQQRQIMFYVLSTPTSWTVRGVSAAAGATFIPFYIFCGACQPFRPPTAAAGIGTRNGRRNVRLPVSNHSPPRLLRDIYL